MLNILVFPCGSEVALELHRSLRYSTHVNLIGASSVPDHGVYVYDRYIGNLPYLHEPDFIGDVAKVVREHEVDAIYPAMDSVLTKLKQHETKLGCKVIGSPYETVRICSSKMATYTCLGNVIRVPQRYASLDAVDRYPVFLKPDVGYGSRGAKRVDSTEEAEAHLRDVPDCIILEYLPGSEFTVDCFTDRFGELRFCGARQRRRIVNGISVNTVPVDDTDQVFTSMALRINEALTLRGAWFFQVKTAEDGALVLLEVASRMGGSSALYRNRGINFGLLSVFDAFDMEVEIMPNKYGIELDRALSSVYRIDHPYDTVYVDFDDCLVVRGKINTELVAFLYQAINEGKSIHLLTRHAKDIHESLVSLRLTGLFDSIIHLQNGEDKADHILDTKAIFIDDSFRERSRVQDKLGIPVFAPDMVESLLKA